MYPEEIEACMHELLDIEIYSASEILKAEGCEENKQMAIAYQMAINRAKKIVSLVLNNFEKLGKTNDQ